MRRVIRYATSGPDMAYQARRTVAELTRVLAVAQERKHALLTAGCFRDR